MRLTRRDFLRLAGLSGVGALLAIQGGPSTPGLRILSTLRSLAALPKGDQWMVDSGQINDLEKIISNYDLLIVPSHILTPLIRQNLVQELVLSNQPSLITPQRPYDPQDTFSRLAARGVIGINSRHGAPPQTWKEFFALAKTVPAYLPLVESVNAALKSLGQSINTRHTYFREQAQTLISHLKAVPLVQAQLAIAPPLAGWQFTIPTEGVELWEDNFAIPVNSTQPALAQEFVERALQRQILPNLPLTKMEIRSAFA